MANDTNKKVSIDFKLTDNVTSALKSIVSTGEQLKNSLQKIAKETNVFKELKSKTLEAGKSWRDASASVKVLADAIKVSKGTIEAQGNSMEATRKRIESFKAALKSGKDQVKALGDSLKQGKISQEAYDNASQLMQKTAQQQARRLAELKVELKSLSAAQKESKATLTQQENAYKQAKKAAEDLRKQYEANKRALTQSAQSLKAAGINTNQLAQEQKKLYLSIKEAEKAAEAEKKALEGLRKVSAQAAQADAARAKLGIRSNAEIKANMLQLANAYKNLKTSGTASAKEIKRAFDALKKSLKPLQNEILGTSKKIKASTKDTTKAINDQKESFESLTSTVSFALAALAAAVTVPFVAAIKNAKEFEDEMAAVKAISSATATEFTSLKTIAEEMGRTTRYTAREAAEGLRYLSMAGLSAAQSVEALPSVLNLAAAGALDLGRAADITTNILTGYGLKVEELGHLNDVLVQTFTNSNTSLEELGVAFSYAGSIAATTGVKIEEVAATLGLLANAGIKACYDNQTEVLTKRGFLRWEEVSDKDEFLTLNPTNHVLEYQKSTGLFRYEIDEDLFYIKTKHIDLAVTDNHRMYVRPRGKDSFEFIQAKETFGKDVCYIKSGKWIGEKIQTFSIPGFNQNRGSHFKEIEDLNFEMNDWLEFYGYFITDGSLPKVKKGNYEVVISQRKTRGRNKIEDCLNRLGLKYRCEGINYVILSQQIYDHLIQFGRLKSERFVPEYIKTLNSEQLEIFYNAVVEGDGSTNGEIFSSYPKLIDDFSEVIIKIGWCPSVRLKFPKGGIKIIDGCEVVSKRDYYVITINKKHLTPRYEPSAYNPDTVHGKRLKIKENGLGQKWERYQGFVYCAEVPNHTLCIRRNGTIVFCGNSLGGTSLRGALSRLEAPSKKAKAIMGELAERIGQTEIRIRDAKGEFVGMRALLVQLSEASLSTKEAITIFGQRAGPGMAALLKQGIPAFDALLSKLKDSEGRAQEVKDTMEDTLGGAFRRLTSAVDGFAKSVGDSFIPVLKAMADGAATVINWITDLNIKLGVFSDVFWVLTGALAAATAGLAAFSAAVVILRPLMTALPALFLSAASGLNAYTGATAVAATANVGLIGSFKALGVAIGRALISLNAWLFTPVGAVVGAVVAAIALLTASYVAYRNEIEKTFKRQKEIVKGYESASKSLKQYQDDLKDAAGDVVRTEQIQKAYRESLLKTAQGEGELAEAARKAAWSIDQVTGKALDGRQALREYIEALNVGKVKEGAQYLDALGNRFKEATEETHNFANGMKEASEFLGKMADGAGKLFKALSTDFWQALIGNANEVADSARDTYKDIADLQRRSKKEFEKLPEDVKKKFNELNVGVQDTINKMKEIGTLDFSKTSEEMLNLAKKSGNISLFAEDAGEAFKVLFNDMKTEAKLSSESMVSSLRVALDPKNIKESAEKMTETYREGMKLLEDNWLRGAINVNNTSKQLNEDLRSEYIQTFKNLNETSQKGFIQMFMKHKQHVQGILDSEKFRSEREQLLAREKVAFADKIEKLIAKQKNQAIVDGYAEEKTKIKENLEDKQSIVQNSHLRGELSEQESLGRLHDLRTQALAQELELSEQRIAALKGLKQEDTKEFARARREQLEIIKKIDEEEIKGQENKKAYLIKINEQRLKAVKSSLEDELKEIETKVAQGLISEKRGNEESIKLTSEKYARLIEIAEANLVEISKTYSKGDDEYRDAQENLNDIQQEFADKRLEQIRKQTDQENKEREYAAVEAQQIYENSLSEIERRLEKGNINYRQAARFKIQAEQELLDFRMNAAIQAVDFAIKQYGRDTIEHRQATQAKIDMEKEYQKFLQNRKSLTEEAVKTYEKETEAKKDSGKVTDENNKKTKVTADMMGKVRKGVQGVGEAFRKMQDDIKTVNASFAETIGKFRELRDSLGDIGKDSEETAEESLVNVGEAFQKIGDEINEALKKAGTASIETVSGAIEQLNTLHDQLSKQVETLAKDGEDLQKKLEEVNENREDLEKDNAEFIKNIQNKITSEYEKQIEVRKSYDEEFSKGQEALRKGEYEVAKEYFLKARNLTEGLIQEMKDFSKEILGIEKDTADTLRDLQQGLMTDQEKWRDDKNEADRLASLARQKMLEGEMEMAAQLFQEAQSMYASLAREVKDTEGNIIMSLENTTKTAIDGVNATGEAAKASLSAYQTDQNKIIEEANADAISLAEEAAAAAASAMDEYSQSLTRQQEENASAILGTQKQLDTLIGKMTELAEAVNQDLTVDIKTAAAEKALDQLTDKYGAAIGQMIERMLEAEGAAKKLDFGKPYAAQYRQYYNQLINQLDDGIDEYTERIEDAAEIIKDKFGIDLPKEVNPSAQKQALGFSEGGEVSEASRGITMQGAEGQSMGKAILFKGQATMYDLMKKYGFASGGDVDGTGGIKIPGFGTTDVVPAMLTKGERVTNSLSTKIMDRIAPGFMEAVNRVRDSQTAKALLKLFGKREKHASGGIAGRQSFAAGGVPLYAERGGGAQTIVVPDEQTPQAVETFAQDNFTQLAQVNKLLFDLNEQFQAMRNVGVPKEQLQGIQDQIDSANQLKRAIELNIEENTRVFTGFANKSQQDYFQAIEMLESTLYPKFDEIEKALKTETNAGAIEDLRNQSQDIMDQINLFRAKRDSAGMQLDPEEMESLKAQIEEPAGNVGSAIDEVATSFKDFAHQIGEAGKKAISDVGKMFPISGANVGRQGNFESRMKLPMPESPRIQETINKIRQFGETGGGGEMTVNLVVGGKSFSGRFASDVASEFVKTLEQAQRNAL